MNKYLILFNKIHIHPLFWLIAFTAIISARFFELLILFFIVFVHELGHGLAATYFSWRVKKIMLLPFGGMVETDEFGNRPLKEETFVVLAGPFQHILLGLIFAIFYHFSLISSEFYSTLINYNLMIFLFNCLPIYPLDGGKIIYLLTAKYFSFFTAFKWTLLVSLMILTFFFATMLVFFPFHLNSWVIALFLYASLYKTWQNRQYIFMRFLIGRYIDKNKNHFRQKAIIAKKSDELMTILEQFQQGYVHTIIVKDREKFLCKLNEQEVLHSFFTNPFLQQIKDMLK